MTKKGEFKYSVYSKTFSYWHCTSLITYALNRLTIITVHVVIFNTSNLLINKKKPLSISF